MLTYSSTGYSALLSMIRLAPTYMVDGRSNADSAVGAYQLAISTVGMIVAVTLAVFTILGHARTWGRREIWYSISRPVAVRISPDRLSGHRNAYLVRVAFENRSREGLAEESFAKGEPITIDLNVPVIDVVALESRPVEYLPPTLPLRDGTTVRVGPMMMCRGQEVVVILMTSGRPFDTRIIARLVDRRLRRRPSRCAR